MNEGLLQEINSNIRYLLLIMTIETLPEETRYVSLRKMGFTSVEISAFTGVPESTIKAKWKSKENKKNDKSK